MDTVVVHDTVAVSTDGLVIRKDLPTPDFTVLKGEPYFSTERAKIKLEKGRNEMILKFSILLPDTFAIPKVERNTFGKVDMGDHLMTTLTLRYQGKKVSTVSIQKLAPKKGRRRSFSFKLTPKDFHQITEGETTLRIDLQGEYCTFFGDPSGIIPFDLAIETAFKVEPIYKTKLSFKRLVLNTEETARRLGTPDPFSSYPEACIKVLYKDEKALYGYTKNNYTLQKNINEYLYHNSPLDTIRICAMDADYFLNQDDLISDTLLTIQSIEGRRRKPLKFSSVDELKFSAKTMGQVNKL